MELLGFKLATAVKSSRICGSVIASGSATEVPSHPYRLRLLDPNRPRILIVYEAKEITCKKVGFPPDADFQTETRPDSARRVCGLHAPSSAVWTYFRQSCFSLKPSTSRALRFDSGASNSPISRVIGVTGQSFASASRVGVSSV